jgi:hypothetical protein
LPAVVWACVAVIATFACVALAASVLNESSSIVKDALSIFNSSAFLFQVDHPGHILALQLDNLLWQQTCQIEQIV